MQLKGKSNLPIVLGYTQATIRNNDDDDEDRTIYYSHPDFLGGPWYDWSFVHYQETDHNGDSVENYYPSRILGFISINGIIKTVIQCSTKLMEWNSVQNCFLKQFKLGTDWKSLFDSVPVSALVHPICVIPDVGGEHNSFFVVSPKRNWSRYFGKNIHS